MTKTPLAGEYPLNNAPVSWLNHTNHTGTTAAVAQHYFRFRHNLRTAEAIIADISYDEHFQLFVNKDESGLYLQVGVIGFDNYIAPSEQTQPKIVYGRKWRIEPELPSSEIIQTAYLALEKAREHEVRERLCLHHKGTRTTPLHGHHDIPLMAHLHQQDSERFQQSTELTPCDAMALITYDHCHFNDVKIEPLGKQQWLCRVKVHTGEQTSLPEMLALCGDTLHFISHDNTANGIIVALMNQLVQLSKQHVEENFCYRGFNRFSQAHSVLAIGDLSYQTRKVSQAQATPGFKQAWQQLNQEVDLQRVPRINPTGYGLKQMAFFNQLGPLKGFAPLMPFATVSNTSAFSASSTGYRETGLPRKQFSNDYLLAPSTGA